MVPTGPMHSLAAMLLAAQAELVAAGEPVAAGDPVAAREPIGVGDAVAAGEPVPTSPTRAFSGAVRWDAPQGCPTQAEVEARIAARVPIERVRVQARVAASGEGFAAEVAIESVHGSSTRTLASPSCESVADALVLLTHVAAESQPTYARITLPAPELAVEPPQPTDELSVRPRAAAAVGAQPPPPPRADRPRSRARATIGIAAIVGAGTLPRLDTGVHGSIGIAARFGRAELGALYLAPQDAAVKGHDASVRMDAWGVVLRLCPAIPLPTRRLQLSICAAASGGSLRGTASGNDLAVTRRGGQPWVRATAGPELAIEVHRRVLLVATFEGGGHVVRPGFVIAGHGRVWAPQRWAAHGLVGMQVRLP